MLSNTHTFQDISISEQLFRMALSITCIELITHRHKIKQYRLFEHNIQFDSIIL